MVTLQFQLTLPLDVAEQEVQAAINAATNLLPSDLPNPPVYSKVNPADPPIMTLAVTSSRIPDDPGGRIWWRPAWRRKFPRSPASGW